MVLPELSGRGALASHFEVIEQVLGSRCDRGDGMLERLGIVTGRSSETADLPDVLKRGRADVGVGNLLGIRLSECLDAAAHGTDVTPGTACPLRAASASSLTC